MQIIREVIGDNLSPVNLSDGSWLNATQAGFDARPQPLKPNEVVWGTPLPKPQVALFWPTKSAFAWLVDGKLVCEAYIRLISGTQSFLLTNPQARVAEYATDAKQSKFGWTANYRILNRDFPFYMRQVASPIREDFAIQVGFTAPRTIPAFSYEYVFIPGPDIDTIRVHRHNPPLYQTVDIPIIPTASTDFSSDTSPNINFLSSGEFIANFHCRDLWEKAQSRYYKIESVTIDGAPKLAVVIGFRFPGLTLGQQFTNDGYFGSTGYADTTSEGANYLQASKWQNTVGTGTLTKLAIQFVDTSPTGNVKLAVYTNNGSNRPDVLVVNAGAIAVANGWVEISGLSASVTTALYYWLTFLQDSTNTIGLNWLDPETRAYKARQYTAGPPNPFGTPDGVDGYRMAMRAYVTLGGGTTYYQTLTGVAVGAGVLSKIGGFKRTLTTTAIGTPVLSKLGNFYRTLTAIATASAILNKGMYKVLTATAVGVPLLTAQKVFLKLLAATAQGTATLYKVVSKSLAAIATGTPVLSKVGSFYRTLSATAVGVVTLAKPATFYRSLLATAVGSAVLSKIATFYRALSATSSGIAGLTKTFIAAGAMTYYQTLTAVAQGVSVLTGITIRAYELLLRPFAHSPKRGG
jgi:hypothetical protein